MASAPLEPSSSQPSPMTESSHTRSDSLEEAEALKTRKRPRLDCNDHVSSEEALADSDSSRPGEPSSYPTVSHQSLTTRLAVPAEDQLATMLPSTNQVTINTRSPPVPSSDRAPQDSDLTSEGTIQADDEAVGSDIPQVAEVDPQPATDSAAPISISSSPARSPEIEVAELEDIDDHSKTTTWKAIGHVDNVQDLVQEGSYVEDSFPYSDKASGDTHQVIEQLANGFYKGMICSSPTHVLLS